MSWADVEQTLHADYFTLKGDQDKGIVYFLGEPVPQWSKDMNGNFRWRYCFPVLTDEGIQCWAIGSKLVRRYQPNWGNMDGHWMEITRHGAAKDTSTTYTLDAHKPSPQQLKALDDIDEQDIPEMLERVGTPEKVNKQNRNVEDTTEASE